MKKIETNNGKKGGWLKGKPHYDKNGNPAGGIKAIVTDTGRPVELEGGEVIINKEASAKHWKELSRINQSAGNGVAISPPSSNFDEDPEEYKEGGRVIEFNANHIPNKWILEYAKKIKKDHPEIWKLGGNIFGNQAFENLKRVSERGYWLDSEKWMYIKWRSYVARHKNDYRIEGVVAMLKWADKVNKGWPYMKNLIEDKIAKIEGKKEKKEGWAHKMSKGGRAYGRTPAPKKDRVFGSKVNKPGSAASKSSAKSIKLDDSVIESIKNKIKGTGISLATAKAVVRRGMGAYSSSHRPTISGGKFNSRVAWGLARLNAFIYKKDHGVSKSGKYTQDDDLMKRGGELSKGIKTEQEHRKTLEKIASGELTVDQAIERTAKDHLKEDPKYYTKLLKMENKMEFGGKLEPGLEGRMGGRVNKNVRIVSVSDKTVTFLDLDSNKKKSYYIKDFIRVFELSPTSTPTAATSTPTTVSKEKKTEKVSQVEPTKYEYKIGDIVEWKQDNKQYTVKKGGKARVENVTPELLVVTWIRDTAEDEMLVGSQVDGDYLKKDFIPATKKEAVKSTQKVSPISIKPPTQRPAPVQNTLARLNKWINVNMKDVIPMSEEMRVKKALADLALSMSIPTKSDVRDKSKVIFDVINKI
jgi:hypothetical protein